jgi:hypothetical protein
MRRENLVIPICFFLVEVSQRLAVPLVNIFSLDLGATETHQATISTLQALPSSLKIVFGFQIDNLPIIGYRRKPYMFLRWLVASLSELKLMLGSKTMLREGEDPPSEYHPLGS